MSTMNNVYILLLCCLLESAAGAGCLSLNNCAACERGICKACIDGYYMNKDSCVKCRREHCKLCSSANTCNICKDGFFRDTYGESNRLSYCQNCSPNCIKCINTAQCTACQDGFYNKYDQYHNSRTCKTCPQYCTKCTSDTQCNACENLFSIVYNSYNGHTECILCDATCTACGARRYRVVVDESATKTDCQSCPGHCSSCNSATHCTTCDTGYYGTTCEKSCQDSCRGSECTIDGCTRGCADGYYKDRSNRCRRCSRTGCISCSAHDNCDECDTGFGLASNGYCSKCPIGCTRCTSLAECTECKVGYYGPGCATSCQNHCVGGECSIKGCARGCKNGYFKDSDNVCKSCSSNCASCSSESACSTCNDGFYLNGQACIQCPTGCTQCSSGLICTACDEGYRESGHTCSLQCPTNCAACTSPSDCTNCTTRHYLASGQCHQCPQSCVSCSAPSQCDECKQGYQLQTNACVIVKKCSAECKETHCNPDGTCTTCTRDHYPASGTCIQCSDNCKTGTVCNPTNGTCIEGCKPSWRGSTCAEKCPQNCLSCEQMQTSDVCLTCKPENYGASCEHTCSEHCKRSNHINDTYQICFKSNGTCSLGCAQGRWGPMCDNRCSNNCADPLKCSSSDGRCDRCTEDRYGHQCEHACNTKCNDSGNGHRICARNDGTCSRGCGQGHWGPNCEQNCSSHCAGNLRCSLTDGRCDRCRSDRYGDQCQHKCGPNCQNPRNGSRICNRQDGVCLHGCADNGTTCGEDGNTANTGDDGGNDQSSSTRVIVGVAFGVLLIVVVVVVVCIVRRRRRKQYTSATEETPINMAECAGVNDPAVAPSKPAPAKRTERVVMETSRPSSSSRKSAAVRMSKITNNDFKTNAALEVEVDEYEHDFTPVPIPDQNADTYYNMAGLIRSRITVDKLQEYVSKKTSKNFMAEFLKFPVGLGRPYDAAMENKANNRYANIYPYDVSRVVLKTGPSDYINASYIDSYSQYNTYIACLGPTDKYMPKFASFWTMIWQEKVEVIVMVTNLMEGATMKCEQYWPGPGTTKTYSDVTVTCHSEDVYAEYTVRSFTVQLKTEKRTLHHIHFTAWPDRGVPDDVTSLIEFRQRVISCPMKLGGPTVVHCSAGIGRTGTYIALDILTREGRTEDSVDVFGCVMAMRGLRVNMVQTAEQYEYLHNALVHSLTFDSDPIQAVNVRQLLTPNLSSKLDTQFEHLCRSTDAVTDEEKKAIAENKALSKANRQGADIPGSRYRPWLSMLRKPGSSSYINAVFVNSFKRKDQYVCAQTPLPSTVTDFLTLVMQTNCPCIVSLDDPSHKDKTVGEYLPAVNGVSKNGAFQVKCISSETTPQYTLRHLEVTAHGTNQQEQRSVYHYQYNMWGKGENFPTDTVAFQQLARELERRYVKTEDPGPIIVHCLTGAERSALFCVVSILIQKMEIEHQVSVVNTVRQVKARRRTAIPNKEQYQFCHQCLDAYIQSFDTYSNFTQ